MGQMKRQRFRKSQCVSVLRGNSLLGSTVRRTGMARGCLDLRTGAAALGLSGAAACWEGEAERLSISLSIRLEHGLQINNLCS